jgi:hypothetical protein
MQRMSRVTALLMAPLAAVTWALWDWRLALAFLAGCLAGYLNFHWLKRGVAALVERMAQPETRAPGGGAMVMSFLLRYFLLAAAAYVIFMGSDASLYAFLAGLFLPVAAMMLEAVYEGWVALRRGL